MVVKTIGSGTINLTFQQIGVEIWVNFIQSKLPAQDPLRLVQEMFKNNY